jgi:nucleoside-diphosphate-sugar epimerase
MPVIAVTSANSLVGQQLIPTLKQAGYTVVALTRQPFASAADQHITDWTNSPQARQVLETADAIVHLSGEIFARTRDEFYQANVRTTEIVAAALKTGRARQVIYISYPDADPDSTNLFLQAKGQAEKLLTDSGKTATIFRVQAILDGPARPGPFETFLTFDGKEPIRLIGSGQQPIHLVTRPDVVKAILAGLHWKLPGTFDLFSEVLPLDELVQLINGQTTVKIARTPVPVAWLFSRISKGLSPTTVDLYARKPARMNSGRTRQTFGLTMTNIRDMFRAN